MLNSCRPVVVVSLVLLSLCAWTSRVKADGGPYTFSAISVEENQDQRGNLPAPTDHANSNSGGAAIPWSSTLNISTTVDWQVHIDIGSDDIGLKIGGQTGGSQTVSFGTGQSGSVAAPPTGCVAANHDVEFFAYEGYYVQKESETYWVSGGFCNGHAGGSSFDIVPFAAAHREWTVAANLITYKNSHENYAPNNYPRPNPYCKDIKKCYWTPKMCQVAFQDASSVGTLKETNPNVDRNWQ